MTQSRRSILLLAVAIAIVLRLVEWLVLGPPVRLGPTASSCSSPKTSELSSTAPPRPQGLRLVLIGDSLTRYSYMSLVYFLRWGRWYDPTIRTPHLVQSSSFDNLFHNQTWGEYSWQTNRMLWPYEICDCYRKLPGALQVNKVVNNRYYYDPVLDNSVVYLDAKGHKGSIHGRIPAEKVTELLRQQRDSATARTNHDEEAIPLPPMNYLKRPFAWAHTSWSDAIRHYVAHLDPPPTHIVMNAGLWPNNFLYQPNLVDDIVTALKEMSSQGLWKTTSYGKGGTVLYPSIPDTDAFLCAKLRINAQQQNSCWNTSWTRHVADQWYWDDKHFYEPVYRVMNEELLQQMGVLPQGYQPLDRSMLF